MMIVIFTLNAVASFAAVSCMCAEMNSEQVKAEEPCHDMQADEVNQVSDDTQQTSKCEKCACDHCKAPPQMLHLGGQSSSDEIVASVIQMLRADDVSSNLISGIDNPPKHIS